MNTNYSSDWSWSKSNTWNNCRRRVYYDRCPEVEGDLELTKIMLKLKKLTGINLVKGDILHKVVGSQVSRYKAKRPPSMEKALRELDRRLVDLGKIPPISFVEYINGHKFDGDPARMIEDDCRNQISNFFEEVWEDYDGRKVIEHEKMSIIQVNGLKVGARVDLITETDGTYMITDWKTGKNVEEMKTLQPIIYALYLHDGYGVPIEDINFEYVYLKYPRTVPIDLERDDLDIVKEIILREHTEAKNALESIHNCPPNPSGLCPYCNYATCCEEGKKKLEEQGCEPRLDELKTI